MSASNEASQFCPSKRTISGAAAVRSESSRQRTLIWYASGAVEGVDAAVTAELVARDSLVELVVGEGVLAGR